MPLGSLIGSNQGLRTKVLIRILINEIELPVIVDAGIGAPSQAAEAMEMGASAVLVNTAVASAQDPAGMARAFALAVDSGRLAFLSGLPLQRPTANASSPLTGFLYPS
jgi:thiazole synthase